MSQTSLHQIWSRSTKLHARNESQKQLIRKIHENILTFAIGEAGTGKGHCCVGVALEYLLKQKVEKIIIVRPAVEAGEHLGFLGGSYQKKLAPYLIPIYDEMRYFLGPQDFNVLIDRNRNLVEILPLAFTRGVTYKNCFVILDEAQNCSYPQLKMFLTRIGPCAKITVTGDLTQCDLPKSRQGGLATCLDRLDGVKDISIHNFTTDDVVRSEIVKNILTRLD